VENNTASVTVVAPTCGIADALATAMMVLPVREALALAENLPNVEAYIILREKNQRFVTEKTSGFDAFLLP